MRSSRARFKSHRVLAIVAVAFLLLSAHRVRRAQAVTFDLTYLPGNGVAPVTDPTGSRLSAHLAAAAAEWSDLIKDDFQIEVNYWWGDRPDGVAASTTLLTESPDGTRMLKATIEFDPAPSANNTVFNYFFDPTPGVHEEFDLQQQLYRDLSAADQSAIYQATAATPLLEAGYAGPTNLVAQQNNLDLYSYVLHELGHVMGVSGQLSKGVDQQLDGDFDLPTTLLAGYEMAVLNNGSGHLASGAAGDALLQRSFPAGMRFLPSATDVLATSSVSQWNQIDLRRKDLLAGASWASAANWAGARLPDAADDAYVRLGGAIDLDGPAVARNLLVAGGTHLRTGPHTLDVVGDARIDSDGSFPFARLTVETGGTLLADVVRVQGAQLELDGGSVQSATDITVEQVSNSGSITGSGLVNVGRRLTNNGIISAANDELLTFTTPQTGNAFDLDGGGTGNVRALAGDLRFEGRVFPFAGLMSIGAGRTLSVTEGWTLMNGGRAALIGSGSQAAVLDGGTVEVRGDVVANLDSRIAAPIVLQASGLLSVPDADDRLTLGTSLADAIDYAGGTVSGLGTLRHNGNVNVRSGATQRLQVGTLDWDGSTGAATTLNSEATLIVDVEQLSDAYDGNVDLHSATLDVATSAGLWQYRGQMRLNTDGSGTSTLRGALMELGPNGSLEVRGEANFEAPLQLDGSATLDGTANFQHPVGVGGSLQAIAGHSRYVDLALSPGSSLQIAGGTVEISNFNRDASASIDLQGGTLVLDGGDGRLNSSFAYGSLESSTPRVEVRNGGDLAATFSWSVGHAAETQAMLVVAGASSDGSRRSTLRGTGGGAGADFIVGNAGVGAA
ncbi:MAG: hypothetical protein KDA61_12980 [Planctomycetales bacterium]|nr:hypothetical protein [Planctomycetales bacterium]